MLDFVRRHFLRGLTVAPVTVPLAAAAATSDRNYSPYSGHAMWQFFGDDPRGHDKSGFAAAYQMMVENVKPEAIASLLGRFRDTTGAPADNPVRLELFWNESKACWEVALLSGDARLSDDGERYA